jgi:hypothetical protein
MFAASVLGAINTIEKAFFEQLIDHTASSGNGQVHPLRKFLTCDLFALIQTEETIVFSFR